MTRVLGATSPGGTSRPRRFLLTAVAVCAIGGVCARSGCAQNPPKQPAPAARDPELSLPSPEQRAELPPDGGPEFNRLIHEESPYLLEHARNPVDWYPWGPEAFASR